MVAAHNPTATPLAPEISLEPTVTLPLKVRASTSAAALEQIRDKLGEEAIVLGTRTVRDAGKRMVEVEATLDLDRGTPLARPPLARPAPRAPSSSVPPAFLRVPTQPTLTLNSEGGDVTEALFGLLQEMRALRDQVREQKQSNDAALDEVRALRRELREVENVVSSLTSEHAIMREYGIPAEWVPAYRRLIASLVDPSIAEEILKAAIDSNASPDRPASMHDALISGIAARLRTKPILGQAIAPPVISIVGPAGSGKTSMVAKIAAHAVLKGSVSVGIISCDAAASLDTLSRVAGALGIPITRAGNESGALSRAVCAMQNDGVELIVVDTPACNLAQADTSRDLWRELNTVPGTEIVAVLSATTREIDLNRDARELSRLGFHRFAFTHMDETLRTGGLLTAVVSTGRPVAALSYGRSVPDGLAVPDATELATSMIRPPRATMVSRKVD